MLLWLIDWLIDWRGDVPTQRLANEQVLGRPASPRLFPSDCNRPMRSSFFGAADAVIWGVRERLQQVVVWRPVY